MSLAADFARGGGGQISSRLCQRTGGPALYEKSSELIRKAHLCELRHSTCLQSPFWRGEGYMLDNHNLMTHFCTPKCVIAELSRYGFRFVALQGDDYPKRSYRLITEWYYYVFQKTLSNN